MDVDSLISAQLRRAPLLEDEVLPQLSAEERELPLYFTEPQQLLSTFTQLEESNLFLIQNCQDIEQQLEELRQMHAETSAAIAVQTAQLEEQVAVLQGQLAQEEAKVAGLRKKAKAGAGAAQAESASSGENASALDALLSSSGSALSGSMSAAASKHGELRHAFHADGAEGKLESLLRRLPASSPSTCRSRRRRRSASDACVCARRVWSTRRRSTSGSREMLERASELS